MQITFELKDDVALIKLSGRMIFDESLFLFHRRIRDLLESGVRRYVVDISEVPHLDSSACGEVIRAYTSIAKAQGVLVFANPSERVRALWKRIKIIDILNISDSLDDAMKFVQSRDRESRQASS